MDAHSHKKHSRKIKIPMKILLRNRTRIFPPRRDASTPRWLKVDWGKFNCTAYWQRYAESRFVLRLTASTPESFGRRHLPNWNFCIKRGRKTFSAEFEQYENRANRIYNCTSQICLAYKLHRGPLMEEKIKKKLVTKFLHTPTSWESWQRS